MNQAIALSKTKLLNYAQCPRRLWLEQYNPELEDPDEAMNKALDGDLRLATIAQASYASDSAIQISSRLGLRSALEQTETALKTMTSPLIFDAAFEFDGVLTQVPILDWTRDDRRIYDVRCASDVHDEFIADAAITRWVLQKLEYPTYRSVLALASENFSENSTGDIESLFDTSDLTEPSLQAIEGISDNVVATRSVLASLEEPTNPVGPHCKTRYPCPFLGHCDAS